MTINLIANLGTPLTIQTGIGSQVHKSSICKVSEYSYASSFVKSSQGVLNISTIDPFSKAQTKGSDQVFAAFNVYETRMTYLEDNKILIFYTKTSDGFLYAKVGTISGLTCAFGVESSAIGSPFTFFGAGAIEVCSLSSNLSVVVMARDNAGFDTLLIAIKTDNTLNTITNIGATKSAGGGGIGFGNNLSISKSSETTFYSSVDITDGLLIIDKCSVDHSTFAITIEKTHAIAASGNAYSSTISIGDSKVVAIYIVNSFATSFTMSVFDFSGASVVETKTSTSLIFPYSTTNLKSTLKISNGSVVFWFGPDDTFTASSIIVVNIYGQLTQINFEEKGTNDFLNKYCMGMALLNDGDLILQYGDSFGTDLKSVTSDFLGGISIPDLNWTSPQDFGKIEIDENTSNSFIHQNDGIFGEDVEITTPEGFYFEDDEGNSTRSATIRIPGTQDILADGLGSFIVDSFGNPIKR